MNTTTITTETVYLSKKGMKELDKAIAELERDRHAVIMELMSRIRSTITTSAWLALKSWHNSMLWDVELTTKQDPVPALNLIRRPIPTT